MTLIETQNTYIDKVMDWWHNDRNQTGVVDYTLPFVRRSLRYVYPMFIFLHAMVGLIGVAGNTAMTIIIMRRRLFHDQTFVFMLNLAFADIVKGVFVLPMTLANLLVQNWLFGSFMCFFLPMMQSFPIYVSMLTFLLIGVDRYRLIVNPFQNRVPACLCVIAIWVAAVCVVLPFAVYIRYIDLAAYLGDEFKGVGICYVTTTGNHIEEYIRALFVTLYVMPLAVLAFLYVKVSADLKTQENSQMSVHYNVRADRDTSEDGQSRQLNTAITWNNGRAENILESDPHSSESTNVKSCNDYSAPGSDDDIDIPKEKNTQTYLIAMTTVFAVCLCPLNILILVTYFLHEDENNLGYYDVMYMTFTWFGFLTTCTNPIIFIFWRMSSSTKDKLRGYFRFSNRNRKNRNRMGTK